MQMSASAVMMIYAAMVNALSDVDFSLSFLILDPVIDNLLESPDASSEKLLADGIRAYDEDERHNGIE